MGMELEETTLYWSFDEETDAEQVEILVRIFGVRAVRLDGPRNRTYTKVLVPSSKRKCGHVSFDLRKRVLELKVATHRANENGMVESGASDAPMYPPLVVAEGRTEKDYRFDL